MTLTESTSGVTACAPPVPSKLLRFIESIFAKIIQKNQSILQVARIIDIQLLIDLLDPSRLKINKKPFLRRFSTLSSLSSHKINNTVTKEPKKFSENYKLIIENAWAKPL